MSRKKMVDFVEITTIVGCRNNCVYCPQDKFVAAYIKSGGVKLMSFNNFKKYLSKIPKKVEIVFAGMSEPWLNKECTEMVLWAHDKGYRVKVFTTLVGMTAEDVKKLERVGFNYFCGFVVHVPSGGKLEKIQVNKEYMKVLECLEKSKIKVEYHFLGYRFGQQPNSDFCKIVSEKKMEMSPVQNRAGNYDGLDKNVFKKGRLRCVKNLRAGVVMPDGRVVLCCQDYGMQHVLGDLNMEDYNDLMSGREMKKIKKALVNDKVPDILCRSCCYAEKIDDKKNGWIEIIRRNFVK